LLKSAPPQGWLLAKERTPVEARRLNPPHQPVRSQSHHTHTRYTTPSTQHSGNGSHQSHSYSLKGANLDSHGKGRCDSRFGEARRAASGLPPREMLLHVDDASSRTLPVVSPLTGRVVHCTYQPSSPLASPPPPRPHQPLLSKQPPKHSCCVLPSKIHKCVICVVLCAEGAFPTSRLGAHGRLEDREQDCASLITIQGIRSLSVRAQPLRN